MLVTDLSDAVSADTESAHGCAAPFVDGIRARALIDALPDAALLTDTAGKVQYLNDAAGRLLGVAPEDVRGRPAQEVLGLLDGVTGEPIGEPFTYLLSGVDIGQSGRHDLLARRGAAPIPFDYSIGTIRAGHRGPAGFVLLLRDASGVRAHIERLVEMARRDEHTHLLRRGEFARRIAFALESLKAGVEHALLFMDLDRFKSVNDHAGHAADDAVLREAAARLRALVYERDVLARLGGDEFGLLLERCPIARARARARTLQVAIAAQPFRVEGVCFDLDVSIGIAVIRDRRHGVRAALSAADAACYRAKRMSGEGARICEVILD